MTDTSLPCVSSSHTPGPWRTRNTGIETEDGRILAWAFWFFYAKRPRQHSAGVEEPDRFITIGTAEADANARLMAAAPALLAACQRALPFCLASPIYGDGIPREDLCQQIITAIAEATREVPS